MMDTKVSYSINYVNIACFVLFVCGGGGPRFTPKTLFPLTLSNPVSMQVLVQCFHLTALFCCAPVLIIVFNVHCVLNLVVLN